MPVSFLQGASGRTRIKICGFTREVDMAAAAAAGADALGFVCWEKSARFVSLERLALLARVMPEGVTPVLLFVNAPRETVRAYQALLPQALLQFHGNETPEYCDSFNAPYMKAVGVLGPETLLAADRAYTHAAAILADAPVAGWGGSGTAFDWAGAAQAVQRLSRPLVLAGGLQASNVTEAIRLLRPQAVDVSSGVEASRGIKDAERMRAFCEAVRAADRHSEKDVP